MQLWAIKDGCRELNVAVVGVRIQEAAETGELCCQPTPGEVRIELLGDGRVPST